jgi:hypothetical protein
MNLIKELKEQYAYLWWWLLDKGTVIAWSIVNFFLATIVAIVLAALYFFLKWYSKHH